MPGNIDQVYGLFMDLEFALIGKAFSGIRKMGVYLGKTADQPNFKMGGGGLISNVFNRLAAS